jgi:ribosomal protein L37AE/L43A
MTDELGREITEPRGFRTVASCESCRYCYKITWKVWKCDLCGWQVLDTTICDDYEEREAEQ